MTRRREEEWWSIGELQAAQSTGGSRRNCVRDRCRPIGKVGRGLRPRSPMIVRSRKGIVRAKNGGKGGRICVRWQR